MSTYEDHIARKGIIVPLAGFDVVESREWLYPFQRDTVAWALKLGRSAIFADTGLGKTRMQLAWASCVVDRLRVEGRSPTVLLLAPLAVGAQTVREAERVGLADVRLVRSQDDVRDGINVVNYDVLHKFDLPTFGGVVLDESSILKSYTGTTKRALVEGCKDVPYRLACTATPAPNDHLELGNHAEFLGIMSSHQMIARWFISDQSEMGTYRLKGHAVRSFWDWVASWARCIGVPSDIGPYSDAGYVLPKLDVRLHHVAVDIVDGRSDGALFREIELSATSIHREKRRTMSRRIEEVALQVNAIWHKLPGGGINVTMEEGVRGESAGEGRGKPGSGSGPKGEGQEIGVGSGSESEAEILHAGVPETESGEVEADAGAAVRRKSAAEGAVRKRARSKGAAMRGLEEMAVRESCREKESSAETVRANPGAIPIDAGESRREVRDLRVLGSEQQGGVPTGGPLPRNRKGSRAAVSKLQPRDREVLRQHDDVGGGDCVLEPILIWCDTNDEHDALESMFGELAFSVRGSDTNDDKVSRVESWLAGERPIMISKVKIFGFGLNFQQCARMIFVGGSYSYEAFYQAVRRCWRFGQRREVVCHVVMATTEAAMWRVVHGKSEAHGEMKQSMFAASRRAAARAAATIDYHPTHIAPLPKWLESRP